MKIRRIAKWVGIGLLLFVASFTWSLLAFQAGERHGIRYEEQKQVADYNDGWQDGQQDLIDRAWNMHYAGKPESR